MYSIESNIFPKKAFVFFRTDLEIDTSTPDPSNLGVCHQIKFLLNSMASVRETQPLETSSEAFPITHQPIEYTCYHEIDRFANMMDTAEFLLHGLTMAVVGFFGLIGNILVIVVLPKVESNTNFNKMLILLAVVDCFVIIFFVLDLSIVGQFLAEEPLWYRVSYPYFIHPVRTVNKLTAKFFDSLKSQYLTCRFAT